MDGYSAETKTVYEFLGRFWQGHTCQPFRFVSTTSGETRADRFELTADRLEQITRSGYTVKPQWECEFDVRKNSELKTHPIVAQNHLITRDAVYGCRSETMRLHDKVRDGVEIVQYVYVMPFYPYVCKYFKFTSGLTVVHIGDACQEVDAMLKMEGVM